MTPVPRVSTRGYYDLRTGKKLKDNRYYLYPARAFERIAGAKELAIMVHGLRNDGAGAVAKVDIARRRLRRLGYSHPVAGFSYDSNTAGAHLASGAARALAVGQRIARGNGRHLGMFIEDFGEASPGTGVRLLGHSLGSQVIYGALEYLWRRKKTVESVHLFGASIPADYASGVRGRVMQGAVRGRIKNYYAPTDEVLGQAARPPLGLLGASGRTVPKYVQKRVAPRNHRFASYAAVLGSFP